MQIITVKTLLVFLRWIRRGFVNLSMLWYFHLHISSSSSSSYQVIIQAKIHSPSLSPHKWCSARSGEKHHICHNCLNGGQWRKINQTDIICYTSHRNCSDFWYDCHCHCVDEARTQGVGDWVRKGWGRRWQVSQQTNNQKRILCLRISLEILAKIFLKILPQIFPFCAFLYLLNNS